MRVTFNMTYRNGLRDIQSAASNLDTAQREVSSGRRVRVASDDPSAASQIVGEKSEMRAIDSYKASTDSVDARLKVSDSVLTDLISNIERAQVKTAAAQTSTATSQQLEALATELEGIRDALVSGANATFRGTYLFSGTQSTKAPYPVVAGVVQSYQGNSSSQQIDVSRSKALDVTYDGSAIFGDLFSDLDQLITAVRAGNISGAGSNVQQGMQRLNEAFDRLTTAQTRVGGAMSSVEEHLSQLSDARLASNTRRSTLEDANMADALVRMKQADTAHTAAVGAVAAASKLSLMDYVK